MSVRLLGVILLGLLFAASLAPVVVYLVRWMGRSSRGRSED